MGISAGTKLWTKARGEADEIKENKALEGQTESNVPAKWMSKDEKQMLDWILN